MRKSKLYEKAMRLSDVNFKQVIGVKKATYEMMLHDLKEAYIAQHQRRGRHSKLVLEDILFMSLKYWRQYVTQKELSFEFEIGEATVHKWIVWVEDTLVKSEKFSLPGKKALLNENEIEIILIDVTETPIERPKKNNVSGIQARKKDIQ